MLVDESAIPAAGMVLDITGNMCLSQCPGNQVNISNQCQCPGTTTLVNGVCGCLYYQVLSGGNCVDCNTLFTGCGQCTLTACTGCDLGFGRMIPGGPENPCSPCAASSNCASCFLNEATCYACPNGEAPLRDLTCTDSNGALPPEYPDAPSRTFPFPIF